MVDCVKIMRETILDAAQALVQDRGLNAVSFQDLADAVGLKKPSLFHHFRSKDALAAALMERQPPSSATAILIRASNASHQGLIRNSSEGKR